MASTDAPGGIAGTGVTVLTQKTDPGPAPQAPKDFKKKGEESNGIIAMIDLLIKDLDKELTEAEFTEKDAQEDYKSFMSDSAIDTESTRTDFQATYEKEDLQAKMDEIVALIEKTWRGHRRCQQADS